MLTKLGLCKSGIFPLFMVLALALNILFSSGTVLAQESLAESYHPYANNYENTWTISEPGVAEMRLHFFKLELVSADYLYMYNKENDQLIRYDYGDNCEDEWTDWYTGDTLKVKLKTSSSGTAWGFLIDQVETRGTVPTPESPSPTTPAPTPTPNPVPTPKPEEVSVYLYGQRTEVNVGEDIVLNLSAVNLITKPAMTVQLILRVPSGMSITATEFIKGGGGQYTASYTVEPGDIRQIEVHIMTNQAGYYDVVGDICYYFGEDLSTAQYNSVSLPVTVEAGQSLLPERPQEESTGVSGTLVAVIIGVVVAATIGVVLAIAVRRRTAKPVTVRGDIPGKYRPSPQDIRPTPKEETKGVDSLAPDRVPEEMVLDIKEGQTGISYERLFAPYVKDATLIKIYDPHIKLAHQIYNLINFCEILNTSGKTIEVKLITAHDDSPESQQEKKLNDIKKGLLNDNIVLDYVFDDTQHDRWIETDTGWRIILGRGLDIFQPREDYYGRGFSDQTKRKCRATTIIYTRMQKDS